jgi:hypothetical protein
MTNQSSDHKDHLMRIAHAKPFIDWDFNIAQILARGLQGLPEDNGSQDWMQNAVGVCLGAIAEAAQPEPEERPIWTEGVCGDGAAILKDGVMQPIESVIAALNAAELAQPEPEGVTDRELETTARAAEIQYMKEHGGLTAATPDGIHAQLQAQRLAGLRAVAARYARPATEPEFTAEEVEMIQAPWSLLSPPQPELEGASDEALANFTAWFCRNYPGPDTIIHKPEWHAPKVFRAAADALARWGRPAIEPVPVSERLPEPGKKVLAHYLNALGKPRTIIAEWVPAKTREDSPEGDLGEYDDETDLFYWPEGWYEQIENWDDFTALLVDEGEITHWQPLPRGPHYAPPIPVTQ